MRTASAGGPCRSGAHSNANQGFGRVDVAAVVGPLTANQQLIIHDESTALDTGDEQTVTIAVPMGTTLLKATLVSGPIPRRGATKTTWT